MFRGLIVWSDGRILPLVVIQWFKWFIGVVALPLKSPNMDGMVTGKWGNGKWVDYDAVEAD